MFFSCVSFSKTLQKTSENVFWNACIMLFQKLKSIRILFFAKSGLSWPKTHVHNSTSRVSPESGVYCWSILCYGWTVHEKIPVVFVTGRLGRLTQRPLRLGVVLSSGKETDQVLFSSPLGCRSDLSRGPCQSSLCAKAASESRTGFIVNLRSTKEFGHMSFGRSVRGALN